MKNTIIFFFIGFFGVTEMHGMSASDKTPLRIEQVTSKSCALVRTKSCSFNKDPRKEDNALLERTTSPREGKSGKSGSCSPRVQMRVRASSVASSSNTDQVGILVPVATSK